MLLFQSSKNIMKMKSNARAEDSRETNKILATTYMTYKTKTYHFGRVWPYFQLFKNGSKTKAKPFKIIFSHFQRSFMPFSTVFKKLKQWQKSSKKLRLTPYHFGRIRPYFQLFKNGSKTKATLLK